MKQVLSQVGHYMPVWPHFTWKGFGLGKLGGDFIQGTECCTAWDVKVSAKDSTIIMSASAKVKFL